MTKLISCLHKPYFSLLLGIDIGTSGIRACFVDPITNNALASFSIEMPSSNREENTSEQDPLIWIETLNKLFKKINQHALSKLIKHLVVDATSSSILLISRSGIPLSSALMYNDKRAILEADKILKASPNTSGARGVSSTLAKAMWLETQLKNGEQPFICHQVDFINFYLTGKLNLTDENNALKLGYDSIQEKWPEWIKQLTSLPMPQVGKPGEKIEKTLIVDSTNLLRQINLNLKYPDLDKFLEQDIQVYLGTTDSIAAFLATGANKIGDAVTSLGSTIVIKLITEQPIFSSKHGIYSHKLGNLWLVGGASNAGGAILLEYFTLKELCYLLPKLPLKQSTKLKYYPLISKGERFPISDPNFQPKITPRPKSNLVFLQALIEGLTEIERLGFEKLIDLGSAKVNQIFTTGGGQKNSAWMSLRKQNLRSPLATSKETDASFGVTQLIQPKIKSSLRSDLSRKNFFNQI